LFKLLDSFVDSLNHKWENRILSIIHFAVGNTLQGEVEHGRFNFGFIVFVSKINALKSFFHDVGNDAPLVDAFDGFSFLEKRFCSGMNVILEGNLL